MSQSRKSTVMRFRRWLTTSRFGKPARWLRDLFRLSRTRHDLLGRQHELQKNQRELLAALQSLGADLDRLTLAQSDQGDRLDQVESALIRPVNCPFLHVERAPDWLENAAAVLGHPPDRRPAESEFYSHYSEMAGGVGHILRQQYEAYLPLLPDLPGHRLLDIGCGAGEFLGFCREHGRSALGIDSDPAEVARARAAGLQARVGEAPDWLHATEERFAAITLFQVIEHLPPEQTRPLLEACLAALAPGGALLIETLNLRHPNALNGFYTDPTHTRPISDNYLSFLFQWYGLQDVQLLYTFPEWLPGLDSTEPRRGYVNYAVLGFRPRATDSPCSSRTSPADRA
ncbi:MAG: class I SAM-dependent methyltransferase [Halothiobacillaceae bacterium]